MGLPKVILHCSKGQQSMLYAIYEMHHAAMAPLRLAAKAGAEFWLHEANPLSRTTFGRQASAGLHLFERLTRRYTKPRFDIVETKAAGKTVAIEEHVVWERPFCRLIHFRRKAAARRKLQPILIVAPMSGHFATLLRNTVEGLLPEHDVYITDWIDAREVPLSAGHFDLDDYTDYVIAMLHHVGRKASIMAVCQPSVPVLVAIALMSARNDPLLPHTMILMGGPVDTRVSPTAVNKIAKEKGVTWFRRNTVLEVPPPHRGQGRPVYPGFLQLVGFMSMNSHRHITAHRDLYWNLVDGDMVSAAKLQEFYDEYMSVMDLAAEFYLQTVERVFVQQSLPLGTYHYRSELIRPECITDVALLTIEGERDDITGPGQTQAAHWLCSGIPAERKADHVQKGVGHYGVFSGRRYIEEVVPVITRFVSGHAG
jgi:poly(3-hydroxybutyrate) depolymerase